MHSRDKMFYCFHCVSRYHHVSIPKKSCRPNYAIQIILSFTEKCIAADRSPTVHQPSKIVPFNKSLNTQALNFHLKDSLVITYIVICVLNYAS